MSFFVIRLGLIGLAVFSITACTSENGPNSAETADDVAATGAAGASSSDQGGGGSATAAPTQDSDGSATTTGAGGLSDTGTLPAMDASVGDNGSGNRTTGAAGSAESPNGDTGATPDSSVSAGATTEQDETPVDGLIVPLTDGTVQGDTIGGSRRCLKIPYAKRPWGSFVGRRRLRKTGCTGRFGLQANSSENTQVIDTFTKALGCDTATDQLTCLRSKSIEEVTAIAEQPEPTSGSSGFSFTVVVDGAGGFLPEEPRVLFDGGEIAKVPYLLGSNTDEGTIFFLTAIPVITEGDDRAALQSRFGYFADMAPVFSRRQ